MLFMKKNLIKGMVALCVCALFASCSKDPGYEVASNPAELAKIQYKEAFIKKYGEIDPNQSWDFTGHYGKATRADATPVMTWDLTYYGRGNYKGMKQEQMKKAIEEDIAQVKSLVASEQPVKFPYTYSQVYLCPAYSHGYPSADGNNYDNYYLGAEYTVGTTTTVTADIVTSNVTSSITDNANYWFTYQKYGLGKIADVRSATFDTWRNINTISLVNADNARWWVGAHHYQANANEYERKTVEYCKLFTVNGRSYIAFDCNGNGDYSDLICWILVFDYVTPPSPVAYGKRYMVEDLGSIGDFDFNDIVFDVVQEADGSQKCYVRALGGIYNITITVGNTTWSKKGSEITVDGETVMADESQMYNTLPPNGDWILAEFPVSGWNPTGNDVSVSVYTRGQNGEFYTNTIDFPEDGDVPMMVAVSTNKLWMPEYQSIADMPASFIDDNNYVLGGE